MAAAADQVGVAAAAPDVVHVLDRVQVDVVVAVLLDQRRAIGVVDDVHVEAFAPGRDRVVRTAEL
ncbi:hypothetical protein [Lysobacter silvisoli]|uniref:Uncharacterized protein n=1 Tax=Lysobacter silvisoli TaxID=2293254 RepID=A0A371K4M9_9GAMM|nr:hypothetical protein [Lysobacter silvisoli]RDZ28820.1 hypothetical protein DX914_06825 [Lysobacter silvisoli]